MIIAVVIFIILFIQLLFNVVLMLLFKRVGIQVFKKRSYRIAFMAVLAFPFLSVLRMLLLWIDGVSLDLVFDSMDNVMLLFWLLVLIEVLLVQWIFNTYLLERIYPKN